MKKEQAWSLLALAGALLLNHRLNGVVEALGARGPVARDTVLAVLPVLDPAPLRFLYLAGMGAWILFAAVYALRGEPERWPLVARRFALLLVVKSAVMLLTPLRIPDGSLSMEGSALYAHAGRFLTVQNDLFFSTHTAAPFLAALLFTRPWAKAVCGAWAVVMAAVVLLGRMHYSVDVAGAFLIAYAVARLGR